MLAFRSLDPFRALREPDRRRRDEERLSRSEQRTLSKTQNNHLTGKAPYKFESPFLQRRESRANLRRAGMPTSDVEELLAERGLDVSYETVRLWVLKFGPVLARRLALGF